MDKTLGANLKQLREALGFTQQYVASSLGITRSAYGNYETGLREMPVKLIKKAGDLLGCDAIHLFDEKLDKDIIMLATAFKIDNHNEEDAQEIIRFKDIVKSYLKMLSIQQKCDSQTF